ncbi:MAG: phospholipid/cholesterol/gamma-HCH transport system substrate-binding protein [Actinomycetota bacterium]|nr:phospholipid/cholesterol/gamma-HCH transport system substrate-binding protein [Actinomycetota bacterium]
MKTTSSLVKLIVFAVVTLFATGLLATTIGNFRFGGTTTYHAVFSDVTGVLKGDDVRVAGVRVGSVKGISIKDRTMALVTFDVDKGHRLVTTSTQAIVRYRNLVGQRYIALVQGAGDGTPMRPGSTIPLGRTAPALDLTDLFNGFKPLFVALSPKDVNDFSYEIIKTLQGEGASINSLLAHTASLTSSLADRDEVIGRTITNLNSVLSTVDQRDQRLSELIVQLQRFVSGLSQDRVAIGSSLTNIAGLAESTAGLVQDARPPIKADVKALNDLAGNLDDNKKVVDQFLSRFPGKLNTITRTATYGSWFNFYLCEFSIKPGSPESQPGSAQRCP